MTQYQTSRFKISFENNLISFEGVVDELFEYTNFPALTAAVITVNLKKLKKINSCGIRELILWLNSLSPTQQVFYEEAPIFFIHQANMVNGIVAPNRKVKSFFCPYFNEKNGEEVEKLIKVEELQSLKAPSFDGLVLDSFEDKYLNFLRLQGERL
jgi:hypothetical protein